ncbi:adenylate cyclase type 10-like [Rhinatrema bivittatum]|uniref:adenylate cyclase type 10-like n=1 Tax=Rhinatrema bivittatum TaxID=194408 RepID=UPI001129D39D|nr:adenylate cyclase type 10-like [Rhinatrema bivittatum]
MEGGAGGTTEGCNYSGCGMCHEYPAVLWRVGHKSGCRATNQIGISGGRLSKVVIGSSVKKYVVVLGRAVDEGRLAADLAENNVIILSPNAWELCDRDNILIKKIENERAVKLRGIKKKPEFDLNEHIGQYSSHLPHEGYADDLFRQASGLASNPELEDALRKYIMDTVLQNIDDGQPLEHLSEMRSVAILFLNLQFRDNIMINHQCTAMQDVNCGITELLQNYQGKINKVFMFNKGCTFLCVFGLPGDKQEDECAHALQCAFQMHIFCTEKLLEIGTPSISVTSGPVFSGVIGHPFRHEYTVIGRKVSLAASMRIHYPGLVSCDEDTYRNCKMPSYFFSELPKKAMKSVKNPATIYEYLGNTKKILIGKSYLTMERNQNYPLLGREKEIEVFTTALNHFLNCEVSLRLYCHRAVIYEGATGYGKSKILAEISYLAQRPGHRVVALELVKMNREQPLYTLQTLMARLMQIDVCDDCIERTKILQHRFPETENQELLCLLNNFFHVKVDAVDSAVTKKTTILVAGAAALKDMQNWKLEIQLKRAFEVAALSLRAAICNSLMQRACLCWVQEALVSAGAGSGGALQSARLEAGVAYVADALYDLMVSVMDPDTRNKEREKFLIKVLQQKIQKLIIREWDFLDSCLKVGRAMAKLYPLQQDHLDSFKILKVDAAVSAVNKKTTIPVAGVAALKDAVDKEAFLCIIDQAHYIDVVSWNFLSELFVTVPVFLIMALCPFSISYPMCSSAMKMMKSEKTFYVRLNELKPSMISQLACQTLGVLSIPSELEILGQKDSSTGGQVELKAFNGEGDAMEDPPGLRETDSGDFSPEFLLHEDYLARRGFRKRSYGIPYYCKELLQCLSVSKLIELCPLEQEAENEMDVFLTKSQKAVKSFNTSKLFERHAASHKSLIGIPQRKSSRVMPLVSDAAEEPGLYHCRLSKDANLQNIPLPFTLRGIALSQLDQMTTAEQLVVKCAAVIGQTFTTKLLHHIFPVDGERQLAPTLMSLVKSQMIECASRRKTLSTSTVTQPDPTGTMSCFCSFTTSEDQESDMADTIPFPIQTEVDARQKTLEVLQFVDPPKEMLAVPVHEVFQELQYRIWEHPGSVSAVNKRAEATYLVQPIPEFQKTQLPHQSVVVESAQKKAKRQKSHSSPGQRSNQQPPFLADAGCDLVHTLARGVTSVIETRHQLWLSPKKHEELDSAEESEKAWSCKVMRFCSPLLQETACELWSGEQLKALHLRCANFLENYAHKCSSCGGGNFIFGHSLVVDMIPKESDLSIRDFKDIISKNSSPLPETIVQVVQTIEKEAKSAVYSLSSSESETESETTKESEKDPEDLTEGQNAPGIPKSSSSPVQQSHDNEKMEFQEQAISCTFGRNRMVPDLVTSNETTFLEKLDWVLQKYKEKAYVEANDCRCAYIMDSVTSALARHWKAVGNRSKTLYYLLETAAAALYLSNNYMALLFLNEASRLREVLKNSKYDSSVSEMQRKKVKISRFEKACLYGLKGEVFFKTGQMAQAENMLKKALQLLHRSFPLNTISLYFKFLVEKVKSSMHQRRNFHSTNEAELPYIHKQIHCLALLWQIYSRSPKPLHKLQAILAVTMLVNSAKKSRNEAKIISSYMHYFQCCQSMGRFEHCKSFAIMAMQLSAHLPFNKESIFVIGQLSCALANIKLCFGHLKEASEFGYHSHRLAVLLNKPSLEYVVLPILFKALILNNRYSESMTVMHGLKKFTDNNEMILATGWYYTLCLDILLQCGFVLETFEDCLEFVIRHHTNSILVADNQLMLNMFSSLALWFARLENWEHFEPAYKKAMKLLPQTNVSFFALCGFAKFLECQVLRLRKAMLEKNDNRNKILTETLKQLAKFEFRCRTTPVYYARMYRLKTFVFLLCGKQKEAVELLQKGLAVTQEVGNKLEEYWLRLNKDLWFGVNSPPVELWKATALKMPRWEEVAKMDHEQLYSTKYLLDVPCTLYSVTMEDNAVSESLRVA